MKQYYIYKGNSYADKTTSLYRIYPQDVIIHIDIVFPECVGFSTRDQSQYKDTVFPV